jgi:hypothetical protein
MLDTPKAILLRKEMSYKNPNAPSKADVLGTWMLSVLSGHRRYAVTASIRGYWG